MNKDETLLEHWDNLRRLRDAELLFETSKNELLTILEVLHDGIKNTKEEEFSTLLNIVNTEMLIKCFRLNQQITVSHETIFNLKMDVAPVEDLETK